MRIFSQQRPCAPLLMPLIAALLRTLPEFAPGALPPLPLLQLSPDPSTPASASCVAVVVASRRRRRCRPAGVAAPTLCAASMHPPTLNTPHAPSFRAARSPSRAPLTGGIAPTPAGSDVPVSTAAAPSAELAFLWLGAGSGGFTSCADAHAACPGCCLVGRSSIDIGRKWWYIRPRASARPWWALKILGVRFMLPCDCSVRAEAGVHVQREHARRLPLSFCVDHPRVGSVASHRRYCCAAPLDWWRGLLRGTGVALPPILRVMRRKATPAFLGRVLEVPGQGGYSALAFFRPQEPEPLGSRRRWGDGWSGCTFARAPTCLGVSARRRRRTRGW
ncbi:hypothetical protein B0H14DRAFT_2694847 [Mycena olivaceomarginata]|nr:hypothetical protein B0H14DRAFT_2694847 [Mycena olivaceomarginata]